MKYLIVVAHPDDEVLGAGASIYKWTQQGDTVDVCIMSAEAKARAFRPEDEELDDDTHAALSYLGVSKEYEGKFPNIEMNTVPHLHMEVPSCTEWAVNSAMQKFTPNCYVEVGKDGVDAKIKALSMYRGVMRPYPHPRSAEYIEGLAAVRGSQWGVNYAESYEIVLRTY